MNQENFTCPYCRRRPSHEAYQVREDKELIDSKYVGMDGTNSLFLDTNRVYSVKICRRCWESQRKRNTFRKFALWSWLGAVALVMVYALIMDYIPEAIRYFTNIIFNVLAVYWIGGLVVLPLIYMLWCLFSRTRMHVKYSDAKNCNALEPRGNR